MIKNDESLNLEIEKYKKIIKNIKFPNVIKASDIPVSDEWMQDDVWDEEYKRLKGEL